MTNPSHTELAAQARKLADDMRDIGFEYSEAREAIDLLRQCAAALESPERVQADCAGGSPCTDCPDRKQCQRGCIRQHEFIAPPTAPAQDAQGWTHWEARIKSLMDQVGMPNSRSLYQAFAQLAHEMKVATPQAATAGAELTDARILDLWDQHTVLVFGKVGYSPVVFARKVIAALRASTPAEPKGGA